MAKVVQLRPTAQALPDVAERYRDVDGIAVLALASLAPACGKTTLAAHLAVQAQRGGAGPAVLFDMTRDGDLGRRVERRGGRGPLVLPVTPPTLARTLLSRQEDGDRVAVIDMPAVEGADSLARVTAVADVVVIACPAELRSFGPAKPFAEALAQAGPRTLVVAGRVPPDGESLNRDAWVRVASGGLCRLTFRESQDVAVAMATGEMVLDTFPGSDAVRELAELWKTVRQLLESE